LNENTFSGHTLNNDKDLAMQEKRMKSKEDAQSAQKFISEVLTQTGDILFIYSGAFITM